MKLANLTRITLFLCIAATDKIAPSPVQAQSQPVALNAEPPKLTGGPWLNTPSKEPVTLESRRGKVTILQFWTFG